MRSTAQKTKLGQKGFTLVEILIAISILSVVSAITIPNFNAFINDQNLRQSQEALKNGIRDAQNRAISGVDSNTVCSGSNNCNYWVIWFDDTNTTYNISRTYSAGPDVAACNALTSASAIVKSEKLQGGGQIRTPGGTRSCIFYKMITADPVYINFINASSVYTACVTSSGAWMRVDMNLAGLVQGITGQGSCP
jgi:prepilin-type N-terminal cleavage/methylation domain-containing protein